LEFTEQLPLDQPIRIRLVTRREPLKDPDYFVGQGQIVGPEDGPAFNSRRLIAAVPGAFRPESREAEAKARSEIAVPPAGATDVAVRPQDIPAILFPQVERTIGLFDISTESTRHAVRDLLQNRSDIEALEPHRTAVTNRLAGIHQSPSRFATENGISLQIALERILRSLIGDEAFEQMPQDVIDLINLHLEGILSVQPEPLQAIHLKTVAEGTDLQGEALEANLHAIAAWAIARPRDLISIFITNDPDRIEDDVDIDAIQERYKAILKSLRAPARLFHQLELVEVSSVAPTEIARAIVKDSGPLSRDKPVGVIGGEDFLKAYRFDGHSARIAATKRYGIADRLILTGTHLREDLLNQLDIIDLQHFLEQAGVSSAAAQKIATMIAALRKLSAAA